MTGEAFAQAVHTYGDTVYRVASSEGTRVTITVEGSSAEWTLTTTVETVDGMIYTFSSDSDGDSKACLDGTEGRRRLPSPILMERALLGSVQLRN